MISLLVDSGCQFDHARCLFSRFNFHISIEHETVEKCISIFGTIIGEIKLNGDKRWFVLVWHVLSSRGEDASTCSSFSAIFAFEGLRPGQSSICWVGLDFYLKSMVKILEKTMKSSYYVIGWNYVIGHLSVFFRIGLFYQIWLLDFKNSLENVKLRNTKQLRYIQKAIVWHIYVEIFSKSQSEISNFDSKSLSDDLILILRNTKQ